METLPALATDIILDYVTVEDLLSCSLVNIGWRRAANSDRIWKRQCYSKNRKLTVDFIKEAKCRIKPVFEEPQIEQSSIELICYWRLVYMKLLHLKNNWKKGNHEVHNVTTFAYDYYDIVIDNDILITNVSDNQCEIWSIKNTPRKQETVTCALKSSRCKCMIHISDDMLSIVQDTLLQVYSNSTKGFVLQYKRLFDKEEALSHNIPGTSNIDEWYDDIVKVRPSHLQCFHIGKYFIGLALNGTYEDAFFHVWDKNSGQKVKEESIKNASSEITDPVYNVNFCPPKRYTDVILVCVQYRKRLYPNNMCYTVVYNYNLSSNVFTKLLLLKPHCPWIYFEDHLVLTVDNSRTRLSIYHHKTGVILATKLCEGCINTDSVSVRDGFLGFVVGRDIVVFDLNKYLYNLVFSTSVRNAAILANEPYEINFCFLDWDLILLSYLDASERNVNNKIEVWSLKQKCKQSTLSVRGLMFPCNNSAKFFIWNELLMTIYMLQFW